jgi:hypothetical protein
MADRLLPPSTIPTSLWNAARALLRLPGALSATYVAEIEARRLREKALEFEPDSGPVGGISLADTELHFATRFSGSSGRAMLALLDPKSELGSASDRIIGALAGGKVALLDVPCGTGAGSAALLATIAALREQDAIPAHPLEISVLGGDKSEHARKIASSVWTRLSPVLTTQGITFSHEVVDWDVKDAESTTSLLSKWVSLGHDARLHFVLASNFSGFLGHGGNLKQAQAQLDQIFQWAGVKAAQIVWIEPQTNAAESLLGRLFDGIKARVKRLLPVLDALKPHATTQCSQQNPLDGSRTFAVRLSLMMLADKGRVP